MKAAVYLRVSKKDGRQDEANQEPGCVRLCAARGWEPLQFREQESGVKDRPAWKAVLEAARVGSVGAVVFWALDRAGRNRVQVAHDLGELFRYRVHVASVQDAWLDVGPGPLRELLVQVMAWVAQGERDRLIERTRAGLDRARAQGKRLGRPPADAARMMAAVTEFRVVGHGLASIARRHGVPRSTLREYVRTLAEKGVIDPAPKTAERRR